MPRIDKDPRQSAIRRTSLGAVVSALCLSSAPCLAVNRCTDAKGKVTYQDTACEQGAARSPEIDTSEAFSTKPSSVYW
jgi:hypothetical protein